MPREVRDHGLALEQGNLMRSPDPELLPESWDYVSVQDISVITDLARNALAVVYEPEGVTMVLPSSVQTPPGSLREGPFAAIRLNLQTSLQEAGITAKIAQSWAEKGIPCNVLAGFHHDVFLCPWDRREEAFELIRQMTFPTHPA